MMATRPLGSLLKTMKGKKPELLIGIRRAGFVPYVDISAVEHGTQRQFADPHDAKVVPAGSLVMVWDGARSGWVGFTQFDGALGSTLVVLTSPLEIRFLAAFLRAHFEDINSNHRGSGIPHVNPDFLNTLEVPLLSHDEQLAVASLIERVTEKTTSCRGRLASAQRSLERFRQAVLAAACSGRLTAEWREKNDHGSGRSLADSLRNSNGRIGRNWKALDQPEPLPEMPESWGVSPFGSLTSNYDGRRIPVKSKDRAGRKGPYRYYGASGIIDHVDDYLFDGDYLLISEDGANLLARTTPIAFQASGKFWVNNHAHVVQGRPGILDRYLEIVLNARNLQMYVTGSAQPKLTQAALNAMAVPVPSTAEQYEMARRVEQLLELVSQLSAHIEAADEDVVRIRQAVLAKAFHGELNSAG